MLLICQSARSLERCHNILKLALTSDANFVFLTETWLSEEIVNSVILLGSCYQIISRSDREVGEHGGVLIASRSNADLEALDLTIETFSFCCCCAVICEGVLPFFVNMYMPLASSRYSTEISNCFSQYIKTFSFFADSRGIANYSYYFLGDYSFPGIDWTTLTAKSTAEQQFLDIVNYCGLNQFINMPTHSRGNILDLVLSTVDTLSYAVLDAPFTDHKVVCFQVALHSHRTSAMVYAKSSFNALNFNIELRQFYLFLSSDPSLHLDYYQSWYDYFYAAMSKSLKVKRKKRLDVPFFISSHTMHLLKKGDTITRKLSKIFSTKLDFQRVKLNEDIDTSIELDRFSLVEQLNLNNTKHCYRLLQSLKSNSMYPSLMFFGNIKAGSSFEKAQLFNTFFSSVFKASSFILPELQVDGSIHLEDFSLTIDKLYNLIGRIPYDSSMAIDSIPSFVLKECAQQLSPLVFEIFLQINKTQQWRSQWKTSTVIPLHKSGSTSDVTNYRPISILPKLSIVFERLLFNFIYSRVCSKIKREQHGFMKQRSTVTQLISYLTKFMQLKIQLTIA